jgi:ribonuclease HI
LEVIESDIDSIYSLNTDLKQDYMAKILQIEIIVDSIRNLIDPKNLETIRYYYFTFWNRKVPYKITILRQLKEKTTILYNLYLKTLYNNSSVLSIYIDRSQIEKGLGIGLGLIVYSYKTPYIPVIAKYRESQNIGASTIVYNRELEGIIRAIKYTSSIVKRGEIFNIFTDNQAGLLCLKAPSDKPGQNQQIRAILATKALKAKGASIELIWVPGYTDIVGNKEVDKLAKIGTTTTILGNPRLVKTSFTFLGVEINKVKKLEYRLLLESYTKPKTQLELYNNIYL